MMNGVAMGKVTSPARMTRSIIAGRGKPLDRGLRRMITRDWMIMETATVDVKADILWFRNGL